MKSTAKIIAIGNSRGVRLPKRLLDELHLSDTVEIESRGGEIIIRSAENPHAGWEESAKLMHALGDDKLLLDEGPTSSWDLTEWEW